LRIGEVTEGADVAEGGAVCRRGSRWWGDQGRERNWGAGEAVDGGGTEGGRV